MRYLYKGEFEDNEPKRVSYTKTFNVTQDDIFLAFNHKEIRTKDILIYYDIKYFNVPVPVGNTRFKTLINFQSLKKSVLGNLNKKDIIDIYKLDVNRVVLRFDVTEFLLHATYPSVRTSKKIGDGKYFFKLNKRVPNIISQSCGGELNELFSKVMTKILSTDKRYSRAFKGSFSNEFIFKRKHPFRYFDIIFDEDGNSFEINIKNTLMYMLYYDSYIGKRK